MTEEEIERVKKVNLLLTDRNCGRLDGNCQCQTEKECIYYREEHPLTNP